MASVTVLTAARTLAIEAGTIVDGDIDDSGHLILSKHDGTTVDAGPIRPPIVSGTTYNPLNDDLYSGTAPTISVAIGTTPTSGYIKQSPGTVALAGTDVRGSFSWMGAGNMAIGASAPDTSYVLPLSRYPNTYASGQNNWAVQFSTDAQIIQVRFKYISTSTMYRLSINGRKVTDAMQPVTGATTVGSGHLMTIDFGSSAMRDIRFDFATFPFGGVYIPATASLWANPAKGGRFMALADSITDGSAQNAGAGMGTWFIRAARLLGVTDAWEQGRGGTGYITAGSWTTFSGRLDADIIAWAPDRLIIWGGYNDNGGSQATLRTAVDDILTRVKTDLPLCRVMVFGCWAPNPTLPIATSITNTDATIQAAALAAKYPFASPITGNVYSSTGVLIEAQGQWITTANAAAFVGADGVHPTEAGHVYLGRRGAAALRAGGVF